MTDHTPGDDAARGTLPPEEARKLVDRLKERVYVTFTALAVVLALQSHDETAVRAEITLLITVGGTLAAVFTADLVAHVTVHGALPTRADVVHMASVTSSGAAAVFLPVLFLLAAIFGWITVETALSLSAAALTLSLIAISYLAARRVTLDRGQRYIVIFAEFVLGGVVIALELLAHR